MAGRMRRCRNVPGFVRGGPHNGAMSFATDSQPASRPALVGVPTSWLIRDVIAAVAVLVGLASYWSDLTRGTDHPIIVVSAVVALCGIALPYFHRAGLIDLPWSESPAVRVWFFIPLIACCAADFVTDVIPGGASGVGAGMALALAGAILAIWPRWRHTLPVLSVLFLVYTFASPVMSGRGSEFAAQTIITALLTAVFVAVVWWLTAGQYLRGSVAAGVLLLGLGIAVGLAMALLGGSTTQPWYESLSSALPGLLLLPALAAAAAPEVLSEYAIDVNQGEANGELPSDVAQELGEFGHEGRVWSAVAANALLVAAAYGLLTAVKSIIAAVNDGFELPAIIRLIAAVVLALLAFRCWQVFRADRRLGFAAAVATAAVIAVLGLTIVVTRSASELPGSLEVLASFALPATILCALLIPRSFAQVKSQMKFADLRSLARFGTPNDGEVVVQTTNPVEPVITTAEPVFTTVESATPVATEVVSAPVIVAEQVVHVANDAADRPQVAADVGGSVADELADEPPLDSSMLSGPVLTGPRWTPQQAADPATPLTDLQRIAHEAPHLRPLVAANPSAYPGLLEWLAQLDDPDVDLALQRRFAE